MSGTFFIGSGARAARTLRLAHALPASHPVHKSMANFADLVMERSGGALAIELYADGLIGQEADLIEQVKAGLLDFTKASASVLDAVNPGYQIFNVPFLLRDKEHWRRIVMGPIGASILEDGGSVVGLTFYDAGARNFYGQRSILHPDDLRGLKIRVQPSPSTVRMIELLDAKPVPMTWSVVYSALQTGIVDGAENNLTALVFGRHGEVAKYYSFTEHTIVPDVLLIGARAWGALRPPLREMLRAAAADATAVLFSRRSPGCSDPPSRHGRGLPSRSRLPLRPRGSRPYPPARPRGGSQTHLRESFYPRRSSRRGGRPL